LNKKLIGLLFLVFVVQIIYITNNTNLNLLWNHNIDEHAFHGSLLRMFNGFKNFDLRLIFGTGFFNYGWLYFLINFIFTAPFFYLDADTMTVIMPRLISSVSSLISLLYIIKIFKLKKENYYSIIILVCFPSFWINSIIFHPDWLYVMFIIIGIYYLSKDNYTFGKEFNKSVILFSISFCIKIQSVLFAPILIFYVLFSNKHLIGKLKYLTVIGITFVAFRLATNPYLINPEGFLAFIKGFIDDMNSNRTNHGSNIKVTIFEKIKTIGNNYLNIISFLPLLLWTIYKYFNNKKKNLELCIYATFILNLLYLLLFVNKSWQHYYLMVMILFVLIINSLMKNEKRHKFLFAFIIISQIFLNFKFYPKIKVNNSVLIERINEIDKWLINRVQTNQTILIVGQTGVSISKIELKFENIHRVYGDFGEDHLYNYNNHYPGKPIIKDFIIISKNHLDSLDLKNKIKILKDSYFKLEENDSDILFQKNKLFSISN